MIYLQQTVVVEGLYDKIRLESVIASPILATNGFSIYREPEKQALLKRIALKTGIVILTDSDHAGAQIRSYLASILPAGTFWHVYIPEIKGKEKRKTKHSAEGLLGVEGVSSSILRTAFERAGLLCNAEQRPLWIDTAFLFSLGLNGGQGSRERRASLLRMLKLPTSMSSRQMLCVLNILFTKEELIEFVCRMEGGYNQEIITEEKRYDGNLSDQAL